MSSQYQNDYSAVVAAAAAVAAVEAAVDTAVVDTAGEAAAGSSFVDYLLAVGNSSHCLFVRSERTNVAGFRRKQALAAHNGLSSRLIFHKRVVLMVKQPQDGRNPLLR